MLSVLSEDPLVLRGSLAAADAATAIASELAYDHPGVRFAVVLPAEHERRVPEIAARLGSAVAEWIFIDGAADLAGAGALVAERAIEDYGLGQDFVFTVARSAEGVQYALERIAADAADRFEADGVLVLT